VADSLLPTGILADLTRSRQLRTARASSFDQTGGNFDYWVIRPGESRTLADLEGPGFITHIWMTQSCRIPAPAALRGLGSDGAAAAGLAATWDVVDPDYYRRIVLSVYWDDQPTPSVVAPLGDFFGLMNSLSGSFASLPLTVSAFEPERHTFGGSAAFNSWFRMPFDRRARIVVENQGDAPHIQYFAIDYELAPAPLPDDTVYFHAHWRRANPNVGWAPDIRVNTVETRVPNLDGADNYVVLETEGRGHYVGLTLAVRNLQGGWWGEGDDMIFIDDDTWPPSLHGTGTEDYLGHAWGMQHDAALFTGTIVHEDDVPGFHHSYRFHLVDPVRFERRIRVTIEHGHANHLSDEWSSTAYWYQTLPSPVLSIPPVAERMPLRPVDTVVSAPLPEPTGAQRAARDAAAESAARFSAERDRMAAEHAAAVDEWEHANVEIARDIRRRFDARTGGAPEA
jgi:hypothetical protein